MTKLLAFLFCMCTFAFDLDSSYKFKLESYREPIREANKQRAPAAQKIEAEQKDKKKDEKKVPKKRDVASELQIQDKVNPSGIQYWEY